MMNFSILLVLLFLICSECSQIHFANDAIYSSKWKSAYNSLHANIRNGKVHPRYLVSVPVPFGLADRILGTITELLIAILSQRAFVIAKLNRIPTLEMVLNISSINTTIQLDLDILAPLRSVYNGTIEYIGKREFSATVDKSKYSLIYMV